MTETNITQLTLETLRDAFQGAGYRVEELTDPIANTPYLRSATGGMAFDIRPGNRLAAEPDAFIDIALVGLLQVQGGDLPLDVVNRWNATRRFGRLQFSPPLLVVSLDISIAGGVSPIYLRAQIELWDRLLQDLIGYLRDALRTLPAKSDAGRDPDKQQPTNEPASEAAPARPSASLQ